MTPNSDIRELEDRIVNVLNQSDVFIEVKRLVIANIYNNIKAKADEIIVQEINNKGDEDEQGIQ